MRSAEMSVSCDGIDCENTILVPLTHLGGGGWDARNVKGYLKRNHWSVEGGKDFCEECEQDSLDAIAGEPTPPEST